MEKTLEKTIRKDIWEMNFIERHFDRLVDIMRLAVATIFGMSLILFATNGGYWTGLAIGLFMVLVAYNTP